MAFVLGNWGRKQVCLLGVIVVTTTGLGALPDPGGPDRDVDERRVFGRGISARAYDEVFGTELPVLHPPGLWSFHLNPRFGGWTNDDYIRLVMGIRANLSRHFDAYTNLGTFFPNPINDGSETGLYVWELGVRYSWLERREGRRSVAAGLNAKQPVGDAPRELSDGYARYTPFITVSQTLKGRPGWLYYVNTSFEFVDHPAFQDDPVDPQPRDRLFLRPGFIYYAGGPFRYALELEYVTNALDFRDAAPPLAPGVTSPPPEVRASNWILAHRDVHELSVYPTITWFPTRQTRETFWLRGNWDVGIRLKIPVVEETGRDFGVTVRFRWFFDYRRFIREELPALWKQEP